MSRGHLHYEDAFADYLRSVGRPFVVVDDAKKAIFSGAKVKSFDLLVYSTGQTHWLADVKGRKLAIPRAGRTGHLENWTTQEDIVGLQQWARVFGTGFAGLLVFAYWLIHPEHGLPFPGPVHAFGGREYLFGAITVEQYAAGLTSRSRRWQTVAVPARLFRQWIRPVAGFL
jgi:hypothetical protein